MSRYTIATATDPGEIVLPASNGEHTLRSESADAIRVGPAGGRSSSRTTLGGSNALVPTCGGTENEVEESERTRLPVLASA